MHTLAPDIDAPAAALAHAVRTRENWRGRPPGDPDRREALTAALVALQASWSDDHERYARTGSHLIRTSVSPDPVRVLRREMRKEEKRLRSALNRTSGTPRAPKYEPIDAASMRGHIGVAVQTLLKINTEHKTIKKVLGSGSPRRSKGGGTYRSMAELNEEASLLLERLQRERRRLKLAWERYERRVAVRDPRKPYAAQDEYNALAQRVSLWREDADLAASELRASIKRRKPLPAAEAAKRWNPADATRALHNFRRREGRMPTKAECHPENGLPHYTSLRRMLGPSPLSTL